MKTWWVLAAVVAVACAQLGDETLYERAHDGTGGSGGEVTFAAVQAVFDDRCAFAGCHGGAAPAADLDLSAGSAYRALLGPDGSGGVASRHRLCAGAPQVEPGAPDDSCLWILVDGGQMPPGGGLSPQQRATIRGWIEQGAAAQ